MSRSIAVIVLAAGEGSRFRQVAGADKDKLLADCTGRDGAVRSVIEQVLLNLPGSLDRRVLVTTEARPQAMRMAQAYGCDVVSIESTGMGDSIAAGVAACPDADGWLIVLGDMPFILPSSIERVVAAITDDAVSVPVQEGGWSSCGVWAVVWCGVAGFEWRSRGSAVVQAGQGGGSGGG